MKNKSTNTLPKSLKLSPRRKILLTKKDMSRLEKLKSDLPIGWKAELKRNALIDSRTIDNAIRNGFMELRTIERLRNFLDLLDKATADQLI